MIHILQPEVPNYRSPFFNELIKKYSSNIQIYASPGKLGLLTDAADKSQYQEIGNYFELVFGMYFQFGIPYKNFQRNDIVVLSGNIRELSTLLVFAYCKLIGAKIVWWSHYRSANGSKLGLMIRHFFFKYSTACLFYTELEVELYKSRASHNSKCFALNNGIDTSHIATIRKPYEVTKRSGIIFIGRLTKKAEIETLIKALQYINRHIRLEIIGDGKKLKYLKQLAIDLQIDDRIIWHGAIVDDINLANIINEKKLFVYPGSVGLSLLHSLSYGIPAIIHGDNTDHMPEYAAFHEAEVGVNFVKNDPNSLAEKINWLYDKNQDLERMSRNSINLTKKTFNTNDMAHRFFKMVKSL